MGADIKSMLKAAGCELAKFRSNEKEVVCGLSEEGKDHVFGEDDEAKVLGLC